MLSIIIPTYNERGNIAPLWSRLKSAVGDVSFEVVFVDDSTDGTDRVIATHAEADPRVRLFHREGHRGLATAVVEGVRAARGEMFCVLDADLQHPPELIPDLLAALDDADVVVASRFVPGGRNELSLPRRAVSRGDIILAQALVPAVRAVRDPTSGFFICRRRAVEGIELRPIGFKVLLEILARGKYKKVREVPYVFERRRSGKSKLGVSEQLSYLRHLWLLRRSKFER
jgi:dolichol-phosphate mannosyltransferase